MRPDAPRRRVAEDGASRPSSPGMAIPVRAPGVPLGRTSSTVPASTNRCKAVSKDFLPPRPSSFPSHPSLPPPRRNLFPPATLARSFFGREPAGKDGQLPHAKRSCLPQSTIRRHSPRAGLPTPSRRHAQRKERLANGADDSATRLPPPHPDAQRKDFLACANLSCLPAGNLRLPRKQGRRDKHGRLPAGKRSFGYASR